MVSNVNLARGYRRKAWKPTASQRAFLSDPNLPAIKKVTPIILGWRNGLWIAGGPRDVKRGNYIVYGDSNSSKKIGEIYDYQNEEEGFSRGLDQNVYMTIGKSRVLVMDNHNFAAAFIIEMRREGIIGDHAAMAHIDRHDDLSGIYPGNAFNIKEYESLATLNEKLRYIISCTTIESWQRIPLLDTGIVDAERSMWAYYDQRDHKKRGWFSIGYNALGRVNYMSPNEMIKDSLRDAAKAVDIVDIDIDVLDELDKALSAEEKAMVTKKWVIPEKIRKRLEELAELAVSAKVVTIATSPGYMPQERAIIYVKILLEMMRKLNHEA